MDPLDNVQDRTKSLFDAFSKAADGYNHDAVIGAAANILMNVLRQSNPNWTACEKQFDEMFGRLKQVMSEHYGIDGTRRNVFPFHQVVQMEHFKNKPSILN